MHYECKACTLGTSHEKSLVWAYFCLDFLQTNKRIRSRMSVWVRSNKMCLECVQRKEMMVTRTFDIIPKLNTEHLSLFHGHSLSRKSCVLTDLVLELFLEKTICVRMYILRTWNFAIFTMLWSVVCFKCILFSRRYPLNFMISAPFSNEGHTNYSLG